jgi:hypothetical protein
MTEIPRSAEENASENDRFVSAERGISVQICLPAPDGMPGRGGCE